LTEQACARAYLNPGNGSVSRLTHEFRVSVAVLEAALAPYVSSGQLLVLLEHVPESATTDRDFVRSVTVRDTRNGLTRTIHRKILSGRYGTRRSASPDEDGVRHGGGISGGRGELHAAAKSPACQQPVLHLLLAMDHVTVRITPSSGPATTTSGAGTCPIWPPLARTSAELDDLSADHLAAH